eukprot:773046-Rhodomonas_salina.1
MSRPRTAPSSGRARRRTRHRRRRGCRRGRFESLDYVRAQPPPRTPPTPPVSYLYCCFFVLGVKCQYKWLYCGVIITLFERVD